LQDALVFLVEAYFKPVLDNSSEIGYCEVNEPDKLNITKSVGDVGFISS